MQAEDEDCEKTVPLVLESSVLSSPPNTTFVCICNTNVLYRERKWGLGQVALSRLKAHRPVTFVMLGRARVLPAEGPQVGALPLKQSRSL